MRTKEEVVEKIKKQIIHRLEELQNLIETTNKVINFNSDCGLSAFHLLKYLDELCKESTNLDSLLKFMEEK